MEVCVRNNIIIPTEENPIKMFRKVLVMDSHTQFLISVVPVTLKSFEDFTLLKNYHEEVQPITK